LERKTAQFHEKEQKVNNPVITQNQTDETPQSPL
jgi:hypothetical protein